MALRSRAGTAERSGVGPVSPLSQIFCPEPAQPLFLARLLYPDHAHTLSYQSSQENETLLLLFFNLKGSDFNAFSHDKKYISIKNKIRNMIQNPDNLPPPLRPHLALLYLLLSHGLSPPWQHPSRLPATSPPALA